MANSTDLSGIRSPSCRYIAACFASGVIALVLQFSQPVFPYDPLSPHLLAIVFGGWHGDLPTILLSLGTSSLLSYCFFIGPLFCVWLRKQLGLVRLSTLAISHPFLSRWSELQARIGDAIPATSKPRLGGMKQCKL